MKDHRYDETLRVAEDYDLWMRMAESGLHLYADDHIVYRYRLHGTNSVYRYSDEIGDTARKVQKRYQRAVLGEYPAARQLSGWISWIAHRTSGVSVQDIGLMDSSLRFAYDDHSDVIDDSALDGDALRGFIDELIVRQFYIYPSICSAQSLLLVARHMGIRPALVGLRRLIRQPDKPIRSRALDMDWEALGDNPSLEIDPPLCRDRLGQ